MLYVEEVSDALARFVKEKYSMCSLDVLTSSVLIQQRSSDAVILMDKGESHLPFACDGILNHPHYTVPKSHIYHLE